MVNLRIDAVEHQTARVPPDSQPVAAYLDGPELPWQVVGGNGSADWYALEVHARLPGQVHGERRLSPVTCEQLDRATPHLTVRLLDLHFAIDISPP